MASVKYEKIHGKATASAWIAAKRTFHKKKRVSDFDGVLLHTRRLWEGTGSSLGLLASDEKRLFL